MKALTEEDDYNYALQMSGLMRSAKDLGGPDPAFDGMTEGMYRVVDDLEPALRQQNEERIGEFNEKVRRGEIRNRIERLREEKYSARTGGW